MSRTDSERMGDIHAAIARCMAYRDHLDSAELGDMAYDAILRNLAVIGEAVKALPMASSESTQTLRGPRLLDCGMWSSTSTSASTRT